MHLPEPASGFRQEERASVLGEALIDFDGVMTGAASRRGALARLSDADKKVIA